MLKQILEEGLPESLFTKTNAIAAGLFISGAVILLSTAYLGVRNFVTEPMSAPACYYAGERHSAGDAPIPPLGTKDRSGHSIEDRPAGFDLDKITLAQQVCTVNSCGSEEWKVYRSAIFWYLKSRIQHTSKLDREFGDAGLLRAKKIYASVVDRQIVEGLRARYDAGIFRINDFKQDRRALSILVLRGGERFYPCRN